MEHNLKIATVLSGSTTRAVKAQPTKNGESVVKEGLFVVVGAERSSRNVLGRIIAIKHVHEFFEEGDAWTDARRFEEKIPHEVARKYITLTIELLGEIRSDDKGFSLVTVDKPPIPGDPVYRITFEDLGRILNVNLKDLHRKMTYNPSRTPFGVIYGYEKENLPSFLNLNNITMHLAIVGTTGSGKSNTAGYLIERLSKLSSLTYKALPTIVIDAHGDYIDYTLSRNKEKIPHYDKVTRLVFFDSKAYKLGEENIKPLTIDLNIFDPRELAELIINYFKRGALEGAEQQLALLTEILTDDKFIEFSKEVCRSSIRGKIDYNCVFSTGLLEKFIEKYVSRSRRKSKQAILLEETFIDEEKYAKYHAATIGAVKRAVSIFYDDIVSKFKLVPQRGELASINEKFVDEVTDPSKPGLVIVDFSADGATGVYPEIKQFVVYYILKLLYSKFTKYRTEERESKRALLFVIEEAQNYAPNKSKYPVSFSIARDILATIATQGRKFGISLCLITQRPSFVDPIVMSMVNTFIIHRIAYEDVKFVESVCGGLPPFISKKLTLLERGLAVITGQMNIFPFPTIVRIPKRAVEHSIGGFKIFE